MTHDPALKYERSMHFALALLEGRPHRLNHARRQLEREMADYPGVLLWREDIAGDVLVITATKYPEAVAEKIIERRRKAALRQGGM